MFYSDFVLSKKGPLARIWLAAHWDKKLTKAQIFETNIESSIERILKPKVKLALRTSGHLMLGVVRIYSRKTKYLLQDCNEAFVKIKMAFRPGMVDLPEDRGEAAVNAVTLPEVFHDFDSTMVDLNDVDIEVQFSLNQSRADEITMRDDYGNVPVPFPEDGFDVGFDASSSDMLRHSVADFDQSLRQANLIFNQGMDVMDNHKDRPSTSDVSAAMDHMSMDVDLPKDDGFGAGTGGGGLFEGGLFEDTPMPEVPVVDNSSLQVNEPMHSDGAVPSTSKHMLSPMSQRPEGQGPMRLNDDDDFDDDHFIPPSPVGGSSDGSRPPTPVTAGQPPEMGAVSAEPDKDPMSLEEQFNIVNEPAQVMPSTSAEAQLATEAGQDKESTEQNENNQNAEQTTLLQNEEESFALAPVDASALRGLPKTKRKRKLIVDEVKNISGEEMKAQLSDTSDIVITLDLAPPTKRLMHWKETGGVEKLFALPGKSIPSTSLFKNYQRHLTSRAAPNDDLDDHDGNRDANHEPLEMAPPVAPPAPSRRGRKRKQPVVDEEPLQIDTSAAQEISKKSKISPVPNEVIPDLDQSARLPTIAEESLPTNEMAPIPSTPVQMDNGLPPTDLPIPEVPHIEEPMVPAPPAYPETPQPFSDIQAQPLPEFPDMPQQPLDNILQPMSVPPVAPLGQDDITSAPVEQTNMSINNHQDNMMENMGYDEQDQDLQQQMQNTNLFSFNNDDHDNAPITPGMHAGGAVTPWHDTDYDNPASIGPMEERGVDETVEQFEERILNKRAGHLYSTIRMRISSEVPTMFNDLIIGNPKKQVAQKFYSLLVLKKHRVLELTQNEPYDVILLTKGPNFDDPKL